MEFLNTDFDFEMPVSDANKRPFYVPNEISISNRLLDTVKIHDMLEYQGSSQNFSCLVQLSAFGEEVDVHEISIKLIRAIRAEHKDNSYDTSGAVEQRKDQRLIYLDYKKSQDTATTIVFIDEKRIFYIHMKDISPDSQLSEKFIKRFKIDGSYW